MTFPSGQTAVHLDPVRGGRPSVFVVDPSCCSLPYDHSLCQALANRGWEVVLERSRFLDGDFSLPCTFTVREDFYRMTHRVPQWRGTAWRYAKALEHALSTNALLRRARRQRPNIIHYQWLMAPAVDARFFEMMARVAPLVLTLHNTTLFHGAPSSKLQALGFRSVFKHLDAVVVHAEYSKARIVEQGWINEERVHVIPHGVLDYHDSTKVAPAEENPKATILFFGRIVPYKGVDILLKAFAAMPRSVREATRVVVAGPARMDIGPLRQLAETLGIANSVDWRVEFVDERDIPGLFRAATLVALPYRDIDQSGVLLTAIAFDKPVVATRIGGIPETIEDGVHGFLTAPEDVMGFAHALQRVLADAAKRRSMQHAVRLLRTGDLAWSSIAAKTDALYRQLAHTRGAGLERGTEMSSHGAQPVNARVAS